MSVITNWRRLRRLIRLPPSTPKGGQLHCPWTGCNATTKPGRPQDLGRHMLSTHLPYCLFCPMPSCRWRGARGDEFKAHLRKRHPGNDGEPSHIYDTKLVLGYIKDGTPVRRVQKYALDFVLERALELGKTEEWGDLCGRLAKAGWCDCDEQHH
jgi:hypothetical protein